MVSPQLLVQRLKGRLQYLLKGSMPNAFQRNYSLRSIGSVTREMIDKYLASQLDHHPMADARVAERFHAYQINDAAVDLSQPSKTSHAIYWYNLHLVLVNAERYREIRDDHAQTRLRAIGNIASVKGHLLSRAALLPDHLHLALRCDFADSPEQVALAYLNNLAFAEGMKPVFRFGYYVGTFGEYDLGVIPRE